MGYLRRVAKVLARRARRLMGVVSAPRPTQLRGGPLRGYRLLVDPDSPGEYQREILEGRLDLFFFEAVEKRMSVAGATIWDVGAHVGYHTLAFACLVGHGGRVVAFEPNPHNVERLRKNLALNPVLSQRIVLMTCALSSDDGQAEFVFSEDLASGASSGSHLGSAVTPEDPDLYAKLHFRTLIVETAKADTLAANNRVGPPDIMKIDVEGAEHFVLQGAKDLLRNRRPLLLVEVHNITMMFHVQNILLGLGYEIRILDAEHASLSRCFILADFRDRSSGAQPK